MATLTSVYGTFIEDLMTRANSIPTNSLVTEDIRAMLTLESHTPDFDTHVDLFDVEGSRADTWAQANDVALATKSITLTGGTDVVNFDCDNITFSAVPSGNPVSAIIVYDWTGTNTSSHLLSQNAFAGDAQITPNTGDITVTIDAGGVFDFDYT